MTVVVFHRVLIDNLTTGVFLMKKILFVVFALLALVIILPFSFNNAQLVQVNYIVGQYELPLSWLIFGAFIVGVFISLPFFALTGWGWKIKAKSLSKQVDELIKQRQRDEIAKKFDQEKES